MCTCSTTFPVILLAHHVSFWEAVVCIVQYVILCHYNNYAVATNLIIECLILHHVMSQSVTSIIQPKHTVCQWVHTVPVVGVVSIAVKWKLRETK